MVVGTGGRSQRERGARPPSSLKHESGSAHDEKKPSGQEEARGGRAHGPGAVGDSGTAENDAAKENEDDSQEHEAPRTALRGGGLRPDEPHERHRGKDRAARPDGRAGLAFGVKSFTPASETFEERGTFVPAPLLST